MVIPPVVIVLQLYLTPLEKKMQYNDRKQKKDCQAVLFYCCVKERE
jgi:hypothetical protein